MQAISAGVSDYLVKPFTPEAPCEKSSKAWLLLEPPAIGSHGRKAEHRRAESKPLCHKSVRSVGLTRPSGDPSLTLGTRKQEPGRSHEILFSVSRC